MYKFMHPRDQHLSVPFISAASVLLLVVLLSTRLNDRDENIELYYSFNYSYALISVSSYLGVSYLS